MTSMLQEKALSTYRKTIMPLFSSLTFVSHIFHYDEHLRFLIIFCKFSFILFLLEPLIKNKEHTQRKFDLFFSTVIDIFFFFPFFFSPNRRNKNYFVLEFMFLQNSQKKNQKLPVTSLFFAGNYSLFRLQFSIYFIFNTKTQNLSFQFFDLYIH